MWIGCIEIAVVGLPVKVLPVSGADIPQVLLINTAPGGSWSVTTALLILCCPVTVP